MPNIVLIGMPGAGKSTVGVLLAKVTFREFVDTDLVIQAAEGRRLQDIIDRSGVDAFRNLEERYVLALASENAVIATGGSVVYSERAMAHLRENSKVVFLDVPLDVLEKRLTDTATRGIVAGPGQGLQALYEERLPLYRRYADVVLDCGEQGHEAVVKAVRSFFPADFVTS